MAGRLDGYLARRLADWLERSTGEFHLASKYGKNASCSSGGYQRSSAQGYVCFVRLCACRHAAKLRTARRAGGIGEGLHLNERQCRRVAAVVSKSSRPSLCLSPGRSLIKFKYFHAVQTARRDGRWMSESETVGGYLIQSSSVRDILLPTNRASRFILDSYAYPRHRELKFVKPGRRNENEGDICRIMFERRKKLYEICYFKSRSKHAGTAHSANCYG